MILLMTSANGSATWLWGNGRLRSGWRVAIYFVLVRILQIGGALVASLGVSMVLVLAWTRSGQTEMEATQRITDMLMRPFEFPFIALGVQSINLVIVLGTIWFFRRTLDKRSFASLGATFASGWWREFCGGALFVFGAWVALFTLALAFGAVTIAGWAWDGASLGGGLTTLAVGLLFNVLVGIAEETDSRGYVLQNLAEGIGAVRAILLSSLGFAVLHGLNPGANLAATVGIFFAGVLFALGYYATGRLWFPIGMHAAWNFAEGPLLGFPVSGVMMGGLFNLNVTGPDWLMGGAFGPEAGALALGIEFALIGVLGVWTRRKMERANV